MQTIELLAGTHIKHAAELLVAHAPARADFNGITIEATGGVSAGDIVAFYDREMKAQSAAYWASPEGIRQKAAAERDIAEKQARCDRLVATLPNFRDTSAVLLWISQIAGPADRVGVSIDMDAIRTVFADAGWLPGANCGAAFNGDDARSFAGWIVGQWLECRWLECRWPDVDRFIEDWRAKFAR